MLPIDLSWAAISLAVYIFLPVMHGFHVPYRFNDKLFRRIVRRRDGHFQTVQAGAVDDHRFIGSRVDYVKAFGRKIWIKRDDLLSVGGVNGNKARKFKFLAHINDPKNNIGNCNITSIISYGGIQSNAMVAMARMCCSHGIDFFYVTKTIPKTMKRSQVDLKSVNSGSYQSTSEIGLSNYDVALNNGMNIIEVDSIVYNQLHSLGFNDATASNGTDQNHHKNLHSLLSGIINPKSQIELPVMSQCKFVPQGGALAEAVDGVNDLVDELWEQISQNNNRKPWKVLFIEYYQFFFEFQKKVFFLFFLN